MPLRPSPRARRSSISRSFSPTSTARRRTPAMRQTSRVSTSSEARAPPMTSTDSTNAVTYSPKVVCGYPHTTFGLYVTAFVLSVLVIGGARASYEVLTRDVWRMAGVRRRAVLVGENDRLIELRRALGLGRSGIDYDFLGALTPDGGEDPLLAVLGSVHDLAQVLDERHPDELIISGVELDDRDLLVLVEEAHKRGVKVQIAPTTTELLTQRAEYVPGQGVPL